MRHRPLQSPADDRSRDPGDSTLRRTTTTIAVLLAGAAVVVVAGPRPDRDITLRPVELSADLESYLSASEARYTDITPGAEKVILWADDAVRSRTDVSVVYLHGYSATRQETYPLTERVARALSANAFLTRLTGHGRPGEALAEATLNDWANDAAEALEIGLQLGDRVVLVGTSTGATLALWSAARDEWQDRLAALVLISPNFEPADPGAAILTWPWGGLIARTVVGPYREWQPVNERQERFWTTRYPTRALLAMAALVSEVASMDPTRVVVPTLVLYSRFDRTVSVEAIRAMADGLAGGTARVVDVGRVGDPDDHVLAGDILSPGDTPRITEAVVGFLAEALGPGL